MQESTNNIIKIHIICINGGDPFNSVLAEMIDYVYFKLLDLLVQFITSATKQRMHAIFQISLFTNNIVLDISMSVISLSFAEFHIQIRQINLSFLLFDKHPLLHTRNL